MKRLLAIILALAIVFSLSIGISGEDTIVYVTKTGTKYHNAGCSHLRSSKISMTLSAAISQGYTPCSDCHAPTAPATHTHSWDSGKVTTAATCTKAGVRTYTCTGCGQTKTESIPATGTHTWDSGKVTTAATCSKAGVRTYTCTGCGQTKTESIPVDLNAHDWRCIKVIYEPVEDQHGYGTFKCELCNRTKNDDICPSSNFTDVKNDWSHKGIDFAVYNGITNGTDSTHFSPDTTCTRGQVVTFLWRAAGCPEPKSIYTPFADVVTNAFYAKAVAWAVEENLTNGTDYRHFSPDQGCTRGQVVTFLYRFMQGKGHSSENNPFEDVEEGSFYYRPVIWAVGNEITNGLDASHFRPDTSCTRAQIVTFLYRSMKKESQEER